MVLTLSKLFPGERATVQDVLASSPSIRLRLLEMGLTRGTPIEVIRFAPFGDPIEIALRGYRLSLRRSEAETVAVARNED
jgi:ferrous iron transport protein A